MIGLVKEFKRAQRGIISTSPAADVCLRLASRGSTFARAGLESACAVTVVHHRPFRSRSHRTNPHLALSLSKPLDWPPAIGLSNCSKMLQIVKGCSCYKDIPFITLVEGT